MTYVLMWTLFSKPNSVISFIMLVLLHILLTGTEHESFQSRMYIAAMVPKQHMGNINFFSTGV